MMNGPAEMSCFAGAALLCFFLAHMKNICMYIFAQTLGPKLVGEIASICDAMRGDENECRRFAGIN